MTAASRPLPRATAGAAFHALRPRQWTKNVLLVAGLLFAGQVGDASRWAHALAAFVAYCAVSSAAYLVNDVRDAEHDRLHPTKRFRPVASGDLGAATALVLSSVLLVAGLAVAAALGLESLALLGAFVVLQGAYTLRLKELPVVDVLAISGGFVLRAAAGAAAVDVRISGWLLLCTALLALFLASAKRRGELALVAAGRTPGRPVLARYPLGLVDAFVVVSAAAAFAAYVLYALTGHDTKDMLVTVPFVAYGLLRYLQLVRRDLGEEPENVLLTDVPILTTVVLWALVAATVVVVS